MLTCDFNVVTIESFYEIPTQVVKHDLNYTINLNNNNISYTFDKTECLIDVFKYLCT